MRSRLLLGLLVSHIAVVAGCSSDGVGGAADPTAITVSYRNKIRVPVDGATLTADRFATQIKALDPIGGVRCGAEDSPAYKDLTSFLGGIAWSHPMAIIKDSSYPPLYKGPIDFSQSERGADAPSAGASNAAGPAPTIERPNLVGIRDGIAVFLSKLHGLIAVDARGAAPNVSCSMKLPGQPMNFFFKGSELVVVVNALGTNRSALMRYSVDGGKFRFVDAVKLENQTVRDARLFDSTLVAYTDWSKDAPNPTIPDPPPMGDGVTYGGAYRGGAGGADMAGSPSVMPAGGSGGDRLGSKVIVVNWDDALGIDWQDSLMDDPKKQDPMEGRDPNEKLQPGQIVYTQNQWLSFVAASDRYIAIPRTVQTTRFDHYESYQYQVCTAYNPQDHQVESCSVQYEKRPNPDYHAPDPATGDYSCNGKSLSDCIDEAAPVVSQYVYVPVSQSCQMVWVGACTKYETKTATYPAFTTDQETDLTIYRFENGSFTKLDSTLMTMNPKSNALAFDIGPLAVKGLIANRNQVQFQNGRLYVFADQALQTLAVAGNSVSYVNRLAIASDTGQNPSVVFSPDRAMISSMQYNGSHPSSEVTMISLAQPSIPTILKSFTMPGQSSQLLLASGGILGPGDVQFSHSQVERSLQKVTLFSNDDGHELDNLLLGTEYDTFESSWLAAEDDQRIRLGSSGGRMFLPYSGVHHADQYAPTAHRLNVTRIDTGRLVSERSFETNDEIIRTTAIDDARSLVFGNSATYLIDHTSGDWVLSTLREMFVPFATYRMSDTGLSARLNRVGSKCRVLTFGGDGEILGNAPLAQADVSCPEGAAPTGFKKSLFWAQTRTGVAISDDGKKIDILSADDVAALQAKLPTNQYCYIDGGTNDGTLVDYLDDVPIGIICGSTSP